MYVGWMDGWMDRQVGGIDEWMDRWMDVYQHDHIKMDMIIQGSGGDTDDHDD